MESNQNLSRINNNKQKETILFSCEENEKAPILIATLGNPNQKKIQINLGEGNMSDFSEINNYILNKISSNTEISFLVDENVSSSSHYLERVTIAIKEAYESVYIKIKDEMENIYNDRLED